MKSDKQFLLVEPVAKTPYPPLGLMKISSMLKKKYKNCEVYSQVGNQVPGEITYPDEIYITSLFTWDIDKVISSVNFFQSNFPRSKIRIGGIAASLLPDLIYAKTGIRPHVGLLSSAENCVPDYSLNFGRKIRSSLTLASRGCIRQCKFCMVNRLEPEFFVKNDWERDISDQLPMITFWDNNWLASPNFESDTLKLIKIGKKVDFNQGLDARLYTQDKAELLSRINIDPIRFAFDNVTQERHILHAIRLAKKYSNKEISVYVLYNFTDTPEDFYYRIDLMNREKVLTFPMEYRKPTEHKIKFPGPHWDSYLLRGLKLSLLFFYRKGMITESRASFENIYGRSAKDFINKLYEIYRYDKSIRKTKPEKLN